MKVYRGSRDMALLILSLDVRWVWAVNITPRRRYHSSAHWTGGCLRQQDRRALSEQTVDGKEWNCIEVVNICLDNVGNSEYV
jgi:hypothetical protein